MTVRMGMSAFLSGSKGSGIASLALIFISLLITWTALGEIKKTYQAQLASSLKVALESTREALANWRRKHLHDAKLISKDRRLISMTKDASATTSTSMASIYRDHFARGGYRNLCIVSINHSAIACLHGDRSEAWDMFSRKTGFLDEVFRGRTALSLPMSLGVSKGGRESGRALQAAMFVAAPVFSSRGAVVAAVILEIDPLREFAQIAKLSRVGNSGETYFVGPDGLMLSESRFRNQLKNIGLIKANGMGMLSIRVADPGVDLTRNAGKYMPQEKQGELTLMAASATAGNSGTNIDGYRDYRGVPVIGTWTWEPEFGLAIASEIDVAEAMRPYQDTRLLVVVITGLLLLVFILFYLATVRLLKTNEENLLRFSFQDGLTGIANRRMFDQMLGREWAHASRNNSPLSVILIDLDHFKQYNDHYGHQNGDACLKSVAEAISSVPSRGTDVVARYGGEEFVLLLPDTGRQDAMMIAARCREMVCALRLPHARSSTDSIVTASLGVSTIENPCDHDIGDLVAQADKALYKAKASGRNRVCAVWEIQGSVPKAQ